MRAKVLEIAVDEPLRPHAVGPGYDTIVLVVRRGRDVLAQLWLPALEILPVDVQRSAIAEHLGVELWRREAEDVLRAALGVRRQEPGAPSVSVVVCTRDRPDDLARCLSALRALTTPPHEILVVDNAPSDDATRLRCEHAGVRYVLEPLPGQSRARNRGIAETSGELVAFTDDDCVPDARWLDDLGRDLADPLVLALTGHVAPLELETPSQYLFEAHGGFNRGFRRHVFDGVWVNAPLTAGRVGAGANAIFRREAFERVGLFAEHLGPGTPARAADDNDIFCRILDAGYRIAYDPARLVRHRHRSDERALRRIVADYGVSMSAFVTARLFERRDPSAFRILRWWWLEHAPADLAAILRRRPTRLPLRAVLGELLGTLAGPWALFRSRRSRRGIEPLTSTGPVTPPATRPIRVVAESPALSVVVPTRDRRERLGTMLDALARQTFPADRTEVVVVLDGCTDGSAELVRDLDVPYALTALEGGGNGAAAARNLGTRASANPVVLFLDDDILAEPGCLAAHAAAHAGGPEGVALGYCPPVVGDGWFGQRLRAWWEDQYRRAAEPGHRWTFYDLTIGNTSLPRGLLLRVGGFDEPFGSRREDWDLGVRLLQAGVPFSFHSGTLAHHHLDPSLATAVRQQRVEGAGDVRLARKHPEVARQLPFAGYRRGLPRASEEDVAASLRRADRLERLGLRTRWRRAASAALRQAYALGVRDELGRSDPHDLLREAPPATEVDVHLDGTRPPTLPALGHLIFVLHEAGEEIARVEPLPPGRQWSWGEAMERTLAASLAEVGMALFRRELAPAEASERAEAARVS